MNVSMVWPTRRTQTQVHSNNERTSALFAAAFAHIEPVEEANDEVGGGGVAHVGVASGGGGFGGGRIGDGGGGGGGGDSRGVVTGGVVGGGSIGGGVVGGGVVGGGVVGGGAIGGGAIGGVGGGSSTNNYNNDNNNEANDYGNHNDDANDDANNNNDDDNSNDDANDILSGGGGMDGLEMELEQMIEDEAGNPSNHSSSITIHSVRGSVVAQNTLKTYCTEILKFLNWCRENKPNWLQAVALLRLDEIQTRGPNEHVRAFKARVQEALKILLQNAREEPILHIAAITAEGFMEYIMSRCNAFNGQNQLKSAYGNHRAVLFHIFQLHNRLGFPDAFRLELGNLYRGFFWQLTRQSPAPPALDQPHANAGNGAPVVAIHPQREKEGKAPMNVELYRRVCRWFVDWGTLDGIFAHTFTILSWNLACRANNTAKICLQRR